MVNNMPTTTIAATTQVQDSTSIKTYLALGDSYTFGQSVEIADRFPEQTIQLLKNQNILFSEPEIIAQTGWTTQNLLDKIAVSPPLKSSYDIVTLLIGVNNQYQHRTQQEYADQFLILLNLSIKYAGNNASKVIVLSIPDYSVTPFANNSNKAEIAEQIDSFNSINKSISTQAGVHYLDVTEFTRLAAINPALIAADGLHPSALAYQVWANSLVPIIKKVL